MPPHASRPLWSAALVAALVAAPGLASLVVAPAGTAQPAAATAGTLTLGWGDSGFGWAAEDDTAAEAASGAAVPLADGTAGLRVVPQEDGDTEQPYPLALRGITAHPVDDRGVIGDAIDARPGVIIDEVMGEPRRLAASGLGGSSVEALDVDHAIDTEWSFVLPFSPADGLPADADSSGGIAYCVAVGTGSVRTADDGTAEGTGAQTVLTFRDETQLQDPAPHPTPSAPTPTSLPTATPQPTDDPSADPSPVPAADDDASTRAPSAPAPAPTSTATTGPLPVEPGDAMTCADVDGAGETAATSAPDPTFTHGSSQDEISTQVDEDGEAYFEVPTLQPAHPGDEADESTDDEAGTPVASSLTGPGLDLAGSVAATHSLGFRLTAAPRDGTVTYRNHTDGGVFADAGHAQQQMRQDRDVRVEHRWGPTRDAHATWSFSRPGVYCVAWAVDGPRAQAPAAEGTSGRSLRPDDVLRFVVGDADPGSIDCAEESEGVEIPFPSNDDGTGDGDDGSDDGSEDGSDGDSENGNDGDDGSDEGGSGDEDQEDRETGGLGGDDRDEDGPGSRSDEDDDEDDDDEDGTRVVAAPASAVVCPADEQAPRQVRDGDYALVLSEDGMRMAGVATEASVPDGSSVIVGDTARRTAAAGIDGFVAPGGQYLATGSAGAPSFTWTAGGFDEAVDLEVQQTAGDGQMRVFLGEGGGVSADGGTLTVEPESSGTLLFGFDRPGEYAVTLSDGGDREVALEFVAGDRYASAQAGTMVSTLFSACPDVSWGTDLLSAQAPDADDAGDGADDAQSQQTSGALGAGWWGVAGAGMGLAGILMVAILIVVLRESRR